LRIINLSTFGRKDEIDSLDRKLIEHFTRTSRLAMISSAVVSNLFCYDWFKAGIIATKRPSTCSR